MIDWHSHVLPLMDDGSQSVQESCSMLSLMKAQGVTHVIATPHFYANDESVDEFLDRRKAAYELLMNNIDSADYPKIICGAEVRYYPGIAKMKDLDRLTIKDTNLILLEMPMSKWTEYAINELIDLTNTRGFVVVLAHIERYIPFQSRDVISRLVDCGILIQCNAAFFEGFVSKHRALYLLNSGLIHFIGSDCHNLTTRVPYLDLAYDFILKKKGQEYLSQMNEFGYQALAYK